MTKIRTIKVGQDAITGGSKPHYALVSDRKVIAIGSKEEMLELNQEIDGRVWLTNAKVDEVVEGRTPQTEDGPCWDTHKQIGMKKKGNRLVPNCVPKEENNPRPRKGRMSPAQLEIMKLHNYKETLPAGSQERKNVLNLLNRKRKEVHPNKPPLEEAFPAAALGLALKAAPTVARVVTRGSGAPIGAAATSAIDTAKKGYRAIKKRFTQKKTNEDIASATTTASIPNPADTVMGPRFKTTNMTDRRYKKKGLPVFLKRFRKYIADNQNGSI